MGGQVVVVYQFGIPEDSRRLAEVVLYRFDVFSDLFREFCSRIKKTQAVIVRFRQELDAACLSESIECAQNLRRIFFELFEKRACYAVRDSELSIETSYVFQKQTIRGKVAFIGYFPANRRIFVLVEIVTVIIEYCVVSQSGGLMNLEVKTYR